MSLTFVPLLRIQRELYPMPRSMEQFREYIRILTTRRGMLRTLSRGDEGDRQDQVPWLIDDDLALGEDNRRRRIRSVRTGGPSIPLQERGSK
jgi:hypothetical protein